MLLPERDQLTTHFFQGDFLFVFFDWVCGERIAKVVLLLLHLHSKKTPHLDIFNDLTGQIILIVWCLLKQLSNQSLVVFSDEGTQMFFNCYAPSIHYLESFDANLGVGNWQDLNLLETAVDCQPCFKTCYVERQNIAHKVEDSFHLELFEKHISYTLSQFSHRAKSF